MPIITIFSGVFCNEDAVIKDVVDTTGHQLVTDDMVADIASELSGITQSDLKKAFSSKPSVFNNFTLEKERSIAYLKLALSRILADEHIIVSGYSGLLIPQNINHVLRVCLIANTAFRLSRAWNTKQLSEEDAARIISIEDENRSVWTNTIFSINDPWNPELFDIVLPMGKTDPAKASALIEENLLKDVVRQTPDSKTAVEDFVLAASLELALINAGHNVGVQVRKGDVVLTINKKVLMLSRLEDELRAIAEKVPGVISIGTRVEQPAPDMPSYKKLSLEMPSKVLLVDDEREFVQTLSERLQMRDMGSAVAYDGKSALDLVHNDAPEVMIIDLKMPGIDGMEILKEVKQTKPEIEIIVLTGHGSEQDKKECMALGAYAYMQKPVDINILSETLKKAHEGIRACRM